MKQLLQKSILFIFPIIVVIIATNYFGDAAKLFSKGYAPQIAKILSTRMLVTNIYNYDERILQKEIIQEKQIAPSILILGSSRSLLIKQDFFDKKIRIFNSSVSGASIEDLIGLFQIYRNNNILPKK